MSRYRWNIHPPLPAEYPTNNAGLPPLIAQLLYNRGITQPSQIESFITADDSLSSDPRLLPDMNQAVTRIYQALLGGENIAIYGDFDVDGITGAALLVKGLAVLGARVTPYIPHRLNEGHGLNHTALEQLQKQGISLVITADCGITGVSPVKRASSKGLDIVITDHHTPADELPPAIAVVDPRRADSAYPFAELAGVGVAFKLLQALYQDMGKENQLSHFLDLVALGTVADMMPLQAENRYLVKQGLKLINKAPRIGIKELAVLAGLGMDNLDTEAISWVLAPRLNAAGRLEHAMTSYRLLVTESAEEARELAVWLGEKNAQRQSLTTKALAKARDKILAKGISPLLLAEDTEYPAGIIGLVAGKLTDEFYRPCVVIRKGDKFSSGSCRSIPEFDIIGAISQCSQLLTRFGGHSRAAGFTLPNNNLSRLVQQLGQLAESQLSDMELCPHLDIDAELSLNELTGDTYQSLQALAPFGQGNPVPTFITRGVAVTDCRPIGSNGAHLKLKLKQEGPVWDAIAFKLGNHMAEIKSPVDIVYNLEQDKWYGQDTLRLKLLDLVPAGDTYAK